jgi:hypothetical protein
MSAQQAELIVREKPETTPAMLLNIAIEKGAELDKLEKLMDLQMKWEANQARKAYTEAMAAFKANPPDIEKDKTVAYGNTKYNHATLANVTDKINAALSQHGLSASWVTQQADKGITVVCRITHVLGHYEETSLTAPADTSGAKNAIQAIGSTISYLQRYTILALTGLATRDMDNDGQETVEYIDDKQLSTIRDLMNDKDIKEDKFCEYMQVESLTAIKKTDFQKAIQSIKAKVKR